MNKKQRMDKKHWSRLAGCMAAALLLATGCIDEDLSKCGVDYAIEYQLELSLTLETELNEQLTTPAEQELANEIRANLENVMTNRARIMDLSFFHGTSGELTSHQQSRPNASQVSTTLYMKPGNYHNIALAATDEEEVVSINNAASYNNIQLRHTDADTIDAHSSAIYMGYEYLEQEARSRQFRVTLYMQNAVPVLVVNRNNSPAVPVASYTRRTASTLMCADSIFVHENPAVVRTERTEAAGLTAFHTVCFPSADTPATRADDDPAEAAGSIWEMDLYTQLPDGKYVKNILYLKEPLQAGSMKVIKVKLDDEGRVTTDNPEVGVSVELDWKPGGDFDVEI